MSSTGICLDRGVDISGGLPREGEWYVLHVKSRQEKILSDELTRLDVGHYLPLVRQMRQYGGRKFTVELPLFAGYLFVRGSLDDVYRGNRTHRVVRIITVADQELLEWELRNLYLALQSTASVNPYAYLRKGIRVEVRSGPLRGLQGFVEDIADAGRVVLQIKMLGRGMSVEVDGATVEPL